MLPEGKIQFWDRFFFSASQFKHTQMVFSYLLKRLAQNLLSKYVYKKGSTSNSIHVHLLSQCNEPEPTSDVHMN